MKVGIIGAGFVGAACAKAMLLRGSCQEIVLLDKDVRRIKDDRTGTIRMIRRDRGVANDLSHGELLCSPMQIRDGSYRDMADAAAIVVTAGINEKSGRAIDRGDARGRLLLLEPNAKVYVDIVPKIARFAPSVPILVVTDPPDALADVARRILGTMKLRRKNPILSAGTFLDTLRFRLQIARQLNCHPSAVDALVLGEHGTSQVYVWSSVQVGGERVLDRLKREKRNVARFCSEVEEAVKYANIDIIEGTGASQHGIGVVTARIVEAMLRDERIVAPIGVWLKRYRVTLSVPAVIGRGGVSKKDILTPALTKSEEKALGRSAGKIREALGTLKWKSLLASISRTESRSRTRRSRGPQ